MARLGDVATYVNGYAFKPSDWSDAGLPIIRIQDLTGNAYQANRYNGKYDKKYEVNDGDILISWSASLGVYVWSGEKSVLNQHIFKVVFDKAEVNKSFFAYQVQNILENAASQTHGATMKHLTKPIFDALPFHLPPMKEQQSVASILDKVSGLISQRKQQLAKLDELVKARFVEMFGDPVGNPMQWRKEPLGNHIDVLTGFPFDSTGYVNSGIKICGGLIIMPDTINWSDCKYWSDTIGFENYLLADNDIVMALDRPWISDGFKIAMISEKDLPCLLIQRTARIRAQDMDQLFIYSLLQDDTFSAHCNITGSLVPHISHKDIKSYPAIVPPIELQRKFASFSRNIKRQKLTIQQSLDKLEVLKKSLMQEYFG